MEKRKQQSVFQTSHQAKTRFFSSRIKTETWKSRRNEAALLVVFSLDIFRTSWNRNTFLRYRGRVKDTTKQVRRSRTETTDQVTEPKVLIEALMSHVTSVYGFPWVAQRGKKNRSTTKMHQISSLWRHRRAQTRTHALKERRAEGPDKQPHNAALHTHARTSTVHADRRIDS